MSTKRKKAKRGSYSRREQRQMTLVVTLLFTLSVAAIAMMAVVNRLPIGRRYTYTEASDMWIRDGGEMQIAAPELILFTEEPDPTPTPTPSPTPTESPEITPEPEADVEWEAEVAPEADMEWESDVAPEGGMEWESDVEPEADMEWESDIASESDMEWESDLSAEDDMGWETFAESEIDMESGFSPETFSEPDDASSPTSGFPLPEGA